VLKVVDIKTLICSDLHCNVHDTLLAKFYDGKLQPKKTTQYLQNENYASTMVFSDDLDYLGVFNNTGMIFDIKSWSWYEIEKCAMMKFTSTARAGADVMALFAPKSLKPIILGEHSVVH
jgi:hypothetical protein